MMRLIHLFLVFSLLSVLAVGGGTAVLPEMQHMTVHTFHWLTDAQFRNIYSLGQVAPGPNMLMVLVIGYQLAGWAGMIVVGVAFFLPDCIITLFVNRWWVHLGGWPWRVSIQRGLAPVAIGLMTSGTYAIAKLSIVDTENAGDRRRGVRNSALAPRQSGRAGAGGRRRLPAVGLVRTTEIKKRRQEWMLLPALCIYESRARGRARRPAPLACYMWPVSDIFTIAWVVKKALSTAPMLMYQHSRSGVSMPGR